MPETDLLSVEEQQALLAAEPLYQPTVNVEKEETLPDLAAVKIQ